MTSDYPELYLSGEMGEEPPLKLDVMPAALRITRSQPFVETQRDQRYAERGKGDENP